MAASYIPINWYWDTLDTNHGTHVWSSASNSYVLVSDVTYLAWLADGNLPTVIDTFLNLMGVLDTYAATIYAPYYFSITTGANIVIGNPPPNLMDVTASANIDLTLPIVQAPRSYPIGFVFNIRSIASGAFTITVKDSSGTIISSLTSGQTLELQVTNKATAAGTYKTTRFDTLAVTGFPTLTGDVTTPGGGSTVTTIKNDVVLAGNPTTTTQSAGNSSTRIATTAFVAGEISASGAGKASFAAHKNGTDQTGIASGTETKLTFGTETFDTGSFFASSTWTPPAGFVLIEASALFTANVVDQNIYLMVIYKNGAPFKYGPVAQSSGTGNLGVHASCIDLAVGSDTYEIYVSGGGAGNKTISGLTGFTYFMGSML